MLNNNNCNTHFIIINHIIHVMQDKCMTFVIVLKGSNVVINDLISHVVIQNIIKINHTCNYN